VPIAQIAARAGVKQLLSKLYTLDGRHRSAVIVGCNAAGLRLADNFRTQPLTGVKCIGFFDDRSRDRLNGIDERNLLGNMAQLPRYVQTAHVDHIYLALPMASQPRIVKILDELRDTTASIFFVPDIFVTDLIQGRVDNIGGMPVFAVRDTPLCGISGVVKRMLDIAVSSVCLILLCPLLIISAVAVKLSSPGPVIFKQRRYGLDGRPIMVYKFRTMTVTEDGEKEYTQVTRDDPRVTKIGARLRQLSLDELPQLFNVLQGQMSIVGPRPHAVAVNEQYRRLIPSYMIRHKVRPGITGWAQVHGFRGGDNLESMTKRIDYDLEYLREWSVGLDLVIIVRTFLILIGRNNQAY
jgi:putative colanic acid biosynthesis UDP-glucose lipid carrier transferase